MNREFLQLAHKFDAEKHSIAGWFWSEKLDGQRAFWDGGLSRGLPASDVPWANVEKHGRFVDMTYATGLWSRYGQPIQAPNWWLDFLPKAPLDGELYAGRGMFQLVESTVRDRVPGPDWDKIRFVVFGMPAYSQVFETGRINNPNFKKQISLSDCLDFVTKRTGSERNFGGYYFPNDSRMFQDTLHIMQNKLTYNHAMQVHLFKQLPFSQTAALDEIEAVLTEITDDGGEGIILQKPEACWHPSRMHSSLKVKKLQDAEAMVVGYVTGRATDRGSKLLGMMGAMIVRYEYEDKITQFELSGFTDEERELCGGMYVGQSQEWARANPGVAVPDWIEAKHFPRRSKVTFRFRELSDDGIPKEARYFRKRSDE